MDRRTRIWWSITKVGSEIEKPSKTSALIVRKKKSWRGVNGMGGVRRKERE